MGAETPEVIERDPAVAVRVGPLSCFCLPPAKPAPAQRENGGAAFPAPPPPREQLSEEDTAAAFLGKGCDIVLLLESVHIGRECCVAVRAWLEASNGSCLGETAAWPAKRSNGVPSWHSARPLGRNGNGSNVAGASTLRLELLEHGSVLGSLTLPLTSIPAPGAFTRTFDTSTGGAGSSHAVTLRVLDPASFGGRKTVYLCRHGESTWNQAQSKLDVYELLRTTDHGLSETGRIQAESLAKSLLKVAGTDFSSILQPDAILVSPLVRAVQTAVIAFGDVALTEGPNELLLMANAREKQNFGGLDSSSTKLGDEIVQAARVELEVLYRGQDDSCALDAARRLRFLTREVDDRWWCEGLSDSPEQLRERLDEFMAQLLYSPHKVVIVVGHSHFFRQVFREFLSEAFKIHSPQLSADLCRKKLCNCGVGRLELELDSQTPGSGGPIVGVELFPGTSLEADGASFGGALACCAATSTVKAEAHTELSFGSPDAVAGAA